MVLRAGSSFSPFSVTGASPMAAEASRAPFLSLSSQEFRFCRHTCSLFRRSRNVFMLLLCHFCLDPSGSGSPSPGASACYGSSAGLPSHMLPPPPPPPPGRFASSSASFPAAPSLGTPPRTPQADPVSSSRLQLRFPSPEKPGLGSRSARVRLHRPSPFVALPDALA